MGKIECFCLQSGDYLHMPFFFFFLNWYISKKCFSILACFLWDWFSHMKHHYVATFWSHQPARFLWGNREGDGIRHSFAILCTYSEGTACYLTWRLRQDSLTQICKSLLAGDVSKSPCFCMLELCQVLLSFLPRWLVVSTTVTFFSQLHTNPWVIPTTAFHTHSQVTEWRHIHVCFDESIYILRTTLFCSVCPGLDRHAVFLS